MYLLLQTRRIGLRIRAFLSLALAKKTTGDIMTVDGGNIQAVLR